MIGRSDHESLSRPCHVIRVPPQKKKFKEYQIGLIVAFHLGHFEDPETIPLHEMRARFNKDFILFYFLRESTIT
jgi:hypothetical protein